MTLSAALRNPFPVRLRLSWRDVPAGAILIRFGDTYRTGTGQEIPARMVAHHLTTKAMEIVPIGQIPLALQEAKRT